MSSKILSSPRKFVIGDGEIGRLARYVSVYGSPLMLVAHPDDAARVSASLEQGKADGIEIVTSDFSGEATRQEAERIGAICKERGCRVVVGLGGGKAIDVGKVVANEQNLPSVIVPTIASNDAPCSKLAVLYTAEHEYAETVVLPNNPDMVIVDTGVIAKAPVRFLVSGMGDAFATYYEARSCIRCEAPNSNGGVSTNAAFALAELCHEILLKDSKKALEACRAGLVTKALENVIEANILLSGLGFESGGLAVAHPVSAGLTVIPETHNMMHGETVAIGTLVQLILENAPEEELREVYQYYQMVGLPTSLRAVGITENAEEKMRYIAKPLVEAGGDISHVPYKLTEEMLYNALMYVEQLDRLFGEE